MLDLLTAVDLKYQECNSARLTNINMTVIVDHGFVNRRVTIRSRVSCGLIFHDIIINILTRLTFHITPLMRDKTLTQKQMEEWGLGDDPSPSQLCGSLKASLDAVDR